jgi:hypothetical protein
MSHTVQETSLNFFRFVTLTIVDYTNGGETVSVTDIPGLTSVDGVLFCIVPSTANTLAVMLFPILVGNKVKLFQFVSGSPVEIATKTGLNAACPCLVFASSLG